MPVIPSPHLAHLTLAGVLLMTTAHQAPAQTTASSLVERGRYLVSAGVCDDCHSPKLFTENGPVPDTTRRLSGHPADAALPEVPPGILGPDRWGALASSDFTAWVGPWGISFTANLTPSSTGLGGWTADVFINTIRNGKHAGVGRALLPPMPWPMYAQLSDDDLSAIFAYLQSLPPIDNRVPAPVPPKGAP